MFTAYLKAAGQAPDWLRGLLEQGWHVVLPSEAEWEKVARGVKDRRIYPWGDKPSAGKANYRETEIGTTSALGCFPKGRSPFGCEEMAGNVWEWCRTPWQGSYKDYDNEARPRGADQSRVVRGGAFDFLRQGVRCSYRSVSLPDGRDSSMGFRVCLSPFL